MYTRPQPEAGVIWPAGSPQGHSILQGDPRGLNRWARSGSLRSNTFYTPSI